MSDKPSRPYYDSAAAQAKHAAAAVEQAAKLAQVKEAFKFGTATVLPNWTAGFAQALVTHNDKDK